MTLLKEQIGCRTSRNVIGVQIELRVEQRLSA